MPSWFVVTLFVSATFFEIPGKINRQTGLRRTRASTSCPENANLSERHPGADGRRNSPNGSDHGNGNGSGNENGHGNDHGNGNGK